MMLLAAELDTPFVEEVEARPPWAEAVKSSQSRPKLRW